MDYLPDNEDVYVPGEEIPESSILPENTYEFKVIELLLVMSRGGEGKIAKRMVTPVLEVSAGPFEGSALQIGPFVLGTDADPYARDPLTWTRPQAAKAFGIIRFGRFLKAIGLKQNARLSELCEWAAGKRGMVLVKVQTDNDPGSDYYGRERNIVPDNGWVARGEHAVTWAVPGSAVQETPGNGPGQPVASSVGHGPPVPQQRAARSIPRGGIPEPVQESASDDQIPF